MNDDPQLIIFEPLKNPRTVVLNVKEDSDTDPAAIFDENGRTVTNYNVLYTEPQSVTSHDQEQIIAYIENWESQSNANVITEKQARKIEKRKRIQAANIRKKERNKKRKAAMKSLIHCAFDRNAVMNTKDVEEERAILQAMKMQNHSIKNVLNVKKNRNRFINLNTNYRPLENSTIELGCRKTPIDVVVLDSDEEIESDDDDIQINIDPLPQIQRGNRVADFSNDDTFRNENFFVTSESNPRKLRNKKVEIVQIVDSSDSDVECVSNGPSVESLSDDDDNLSKNSTSKKTRVGSPTNSGASKTVVTEEVSQELSSLVDSFVNKYIQNVMPVLTDTTSPMDCEAATPQIVIAESVSLQLTPPSSPNKCKKSAKIVSENANIQTNPSPSFLKSKKNRNNHVAFDNPAEGTAMNDDEFIFVEGGPLENESIEIDSVEESVQTDPLALVNANAEKNRSISDDLIEFRVASEDEDDRPSLIDFDSVPSPDYTPVENIPATASNIKAFADFIRNQQGQDEEDEKYKSPAKVPNPTSPVSGSAQRSTDLCQTTPQRVPSTPKHQSHPWLKRSWEKSDEIVEVNEHPIDHQQQPSKPWQKRCNDHSDDTVGMESVANQEPWQNRRYDKSDEIGLTENPPINRNQPESFQEKSVVPEINQSEEFGRVDFDKRGKNIRHSFPNQRLPTQPFQKRASLPRANRGFVRQRKFQNQIPTLDQKHYSNRRSAPATDTWKVNSAVEFFDKHSIRIGESVNKPENVCCNEKQTVQQPCIEPVNSMRKFYPRKFLQCERDDESNEQLESDSSHKPLNQEPFRWQENRLCDTMPSHQQKQPWQYESGPKTAVDTARHEEEEPWQHESGLQTRFATVSHEDQERRQYESGSETPVSTAPPKQNEPWQNESEAKALVANVALEKKVPWQHASVPETRDGFQNSNRHFDRNRYRPEPYEEVKFVPKFGPQFQQGRMPWRNQNQYQTPYRNNRYQRNMQYRNRPPMRYNENNFNRNRIFQSRFVLNQGQRFSRYPPNHPSFRQNTQKTTRFNQQAEGESQHSNNNNNPQRSCGVENNQYQSQCETVPSSSSSVNTPSTQQPANEEVLFTRRNKFEYKANVSDFNDINANDQRQQFNRQNSLNRGLSGNFHQANDVENYESNVTQKLHSCTSNENTFSWENNQSCDFVPFNANQPISSPPPWAHDCSNPDYGTNINAISRREWITDVINSKT